MTLGEATPDHFISPDHKDLYFGSWTYLGGLIRTLANETAPEELLAAHEYAERKALEDRAERLR